MKRFLLFIFIMLICCGAALAWRTPRWGYFPLNVYIEDHPKKAIVEKAFNTWQSASDEIVTFKMKDAKLAASLHVKFEDKNPKIQKKDFSNAVGLAATQSPLGFYSKADLTIFLLDPATGRELNDSELYETSLHEIGHALGLPHSASRGDTMYPQVHGQTFLSGNDLDTLKKIYLPD